MPGNTLLVRRYGESVGTTARRISGSSENLSDNGKKFFRGIGLKSYQLATAMAQRLLTDTYNTVATRNQTKGIKMERLILSCMVFIMFGTVAVWSQVPTRAETAKNIERIISKQESKNILRLVSSIPGQRR